MSFNFFERISHLSNIDEFIFLVSSSDLGYHKFCLLSYQNPPILDGSGVS